jgi:putative hydrolase of the HAD superfamily
VNKIKYILFDLDNTLYKSSSGLADELHSRMTDFVAEHYNISEQEAVEIRKEGFRKYGTTLQWMQQEGNP